MSWSDPDVVGEGEACQHIAQLADVAGPGTRGKTSDGRRCDFAIWVDSAKQMVDDGVEVDAITESGQRHLQGIEAIEQVGAEAPLGDGLVEAGVGSGNQEDIDLGSDAANGAHRPVVKQAQKHGLQRDGHVADLVKEQRAAVSLLDESDCATAPRAGERAVSVAEELGLYQAFGKRGAIDGDEGAGPPAGGMGVAGEFFLASTGFAADEDRHLAC